MPHSLYLGSDLVKARLRDYDLRHTSPRNPLISNGSESAGEATPRPSTTSADEDAKLYKPSLRAIQSCLTFSIWELTISLFTFALFVNSAILIVAGASLSKRKPRTLIFSQSVTSSPPPSHPPPAQSSLSPCFSPAQARVSYAQWPAKSYPRANCDGASAHGNEDSSPGLFPSCRVSLSRALLAVRG